MVRTASVFLGAGFLLLAGPLPAHADLKLCNNTDSRVGVAIGYKKDKKEGWVTEGWWTVPPKAAGQNCLTLLKGNLISQFYYIFAVDYDKGGSWGGKSMMCTRDKVFTIVGRQDCESRGYTRTGFFEVDTGDEPDWTVSLSGDKTTQGK